jgi:hypothetical protein
MQYSVEEVVMKKRYYLTALMLGLSFASIGCAGADPTPDRTTLTPVPTPAPPQTEYEIKTDPSGMKYVVDPDKIVGGGPPKDGIPSIDNPRFVSLQEADKWIEDNELVLGIIYKGEKKVYPLQIMVWHEIVNEVIAGDPLLITY